MVVSKPQKTWTMSKVRMLDILFLLSCLANSLNEAANIDMCAPITRIASDGFDDIYVGGVNFVAQLSSDLSLLQNISIGPVYDPKDCEPLSAPCDNVVKVLEFDRLHNMLLVCGTAYNGTCTLHGMLDLAYWNCLNGDNSEPLVDVLAGNQSENTVIHFLPNSGIPTIDPTYPASPAYLPSNVSYRDSTLFSCRPPQFAESSFCVGQPAPVARKSRLEHPRHQRVKALRNVSRKDHGRRPGRGRRVFGQAVPVENVIQAHMIEEQTTEEKGDVRTFLSTMVVAGNLLRSRPAVTNPTMLSVRHIQFIHSYYSVNFAVDQQQKPIKINVDSDIKPAPFIDYKFSFLWDNFSYFLYLYRTTCQGGHPCISTRIGRTFHSSSSILPYVEIPISCHHSGKKYHLLTSAAFGHVGIQMQSDYVTVPILSLAFGNGSEPLSTEGDPKYGTALCSYTLHELNSEFDYALDQCNTGKSKISAPVSWMLGRPEKCNDITQSDLSSAQANPYVQLLGDGSRMALQYEAGMSVTAMLTHTQKVFKGGKQVPVEKMHLYVLTNTGDILKTLVRAVSYVGYITEVEEPLQKAFQLDMSTTKPVFAPATYINQPRALMYLSSNTKVFNFNLDFCRQHQKCRSCLQEQGQRCVWCADSGMCMDDLAAGSQCSAATESKCPPTLDNIHPRYAPSAGGSVLTLQGDHLGEPSDQVEVSVCDLPCDSVKANINILTCTLRARCETCPDKCNITVSVTGQNGVGNTSANHLLQYVVPNITSFSPTFGPASGGTVIFIQGEYITAGSEIRVNVAGANCEVISNPYGQSGLECRISRDNIRLPSRGNVKVTIDNFQQVIDFEQFEFRPHPQVKKIWPMRSIESGGITMTVEGSNLDSAASARLIFSYNDTVKGTNTTGTYKLDTPCDIGSDGKTVTCQTPNVKNVTMQRREIPTFSMAIDWGGTNLMDYLSEPQSIISVYRDPTLIRLDDSSGEDYISLNEDRFVLRGNDIPDWVDQSDVKVTIGNTPIQVVSMTSSTIVCNPEDAIAMSIKEYNNRNKTNSTEAPGELQPNTTTAAASSNITTQTMDVVTPDPSPYGQLATSDSPDTTDQQSSTESASAEETTEANTWMKRRKRSVGGRKRVPKTPSTPNSTDQPSNSLLTMAGQVDVNPPNSLDWANTSLTPASSTLSPADLDLSHPNNLHEVLMYRLVVRIGNFKENLGFVRIGPRLNGSWDREDELKGTHIDLEILLGACVSGVVVFALVAIAVAMYIRARKARALVSRQAFYMGSLSGSQGAGSKEAAFPTLKEILESVMEPNKRADMDKLIIDLDLLTVGKSIGSGNFGCVYEGLLKSEDSSSAVKVAVKTLQDPMSHNIDLHGFVLEAVIMRDFQHPHVLGLVGLAEKEPGIPYVILPYMDNGDLLTYIREPSVTVSLHNVIKFGADIASGMAYLSSLKFVHRDLAARNCMLDSQYRVKVADFGLCRDIYEKGYYTSDNRKKLPIRWMAIESIEQGAYSSKSDVWSLGVVLWELLSRGVTPYPGVDGWDVVNYLRQRRLAPPFFCPDQLYGLMMKCWAKEPNLRPTFKTIQMELLLMIGQSPPLTDSLPRKDKRREPATPTPSEASLSPTSSKSPPPTLPKPIPRIRVSKQKSTGTAADSDAYHDYENELNLREEKPTEDESKSAENVQGEKRYSDILSIPKSTMLKNVLLTIPACYSHRDVSKSAAGMYIQLVDNYEPPPKFSNPLLRSKKKRSKKSSERTSHDKRKGDTPPADMPGYSVPHDNPVLRSSAGKDLRHRLAGSSTGSVEVKAAKDYYELETNSMRSSAASDGDSHSGRSSSVLNNTGSVGSFLDLHGRTSSSISGGRISGASSLSVPVTHRATHSPSQPSPGHKKSPLASPAKNLSAVSLANGQEEDGEINTFL